MALRAFRPSVDITVTADDYCGLIRKLDHDLLRISRAQPMNHYTRHHARQLQDLPNGVTCPGCGAFVRDGELHPTECMFPEPGHYAHRQVAKRLTDWQDGCASGFLMGCAFGAVLTLIGLRLFL